MSPTESIHRHRCPAIRALAQLSGGGSGTLWWALFRTVMFLYRKDPATQLRPTALHCYFSDAQSLQNCRACVSSLIACKAQAAHHLARCAARFALALLGATTWSLQALGDLLKTTHRGYFIPPRPEKNPVEGQRASADFVEGRRTALQHYLEQLAAHPVISQSKVPMRPDNGSQHYVHLVLKDSPMLLHSSLMWPGRLCLISRPSGSSASCCNQTDRPCLCAPTYLMS